MLHCNNKTIDCLSMFYKTTNRNLLQKLNSKTSLLLISLIFSTFLIKAQEQAIIYWDSRDCDLGEVKADDEKHSCKFEFTNKGNSDIYIISVRTTCRCTEEAEYSRKPVKPGKKGYVKLFFNPKEEEGKINETVFITTNARPRESTLSIKAKIIN